MPDYIYHAAPSSYMDSLYHAQRLGINKLISPSSINKIKAATANVANSARSAVAKAGGAVEREWKKHKWVARKRGKNGKWIYDYGNGYPDEKSNNSKKRIIKLDTPEKKEEFKKARIKAHYERLHGGTKKSKFKDLDYDSDDYVVRSGQKVRKSEDGSAYVKSLNPYKRPVFGKTAKEAARKANEEKQKHSHSLKTKRGRQVY